MLKDLSVLALCLFGFLLPACGQDPRLTNINYPMDTNVSVGATVSFRVYASSTNPPMTYQWQHEGTNVPGSATNFLVLTNVTVAHAGGYTAWITNAIGGHTNSRTAALTVDATFAQIFNALSTNTILAWNVGWIDYDGDGYVDFYAVPGPIQTAQPSLYHNEGNGTFRKVTTNAIAQTAVLAFAFVWGDYDNDGRPDLFVPNNGAMNDMLFHNDGNGKFTRIMTGPIVSDAVNSRGAAWVDYNRDGFLDLFVTTANFGCPDQNDILYRNNGDGTFRKMTAVEVGPVVSDLAKGDYLVWADVDGDGWSELSRTISPGCVTAPWTNEVWHVDQEGKFYQMDIGELKQGLAGFTIATWADYDNDGFQDAVVYVGNGPTGFYRNLAGQGFTNIANSVFPTAITNGYPWFVGDYDNDGWLDLGFLGSSGNPALLYRNNGDGTFTRQFVGGLTSTADGWMVWGDYNNDGFRDVWVGIGTSNKGLLFQHNGGTNHWLKVKLDGRASNRSGIGAKVRVYATIGGRTFWQMREISGEGIGLDNGLIAHFGLGDATNVTTLRIEWPSGIVQELHDVAANQFRTVVESQGYTNELRPSFTGATKDASGSQLSFTEPAAGARYILEASTNLVTWTKLLARTSVGVTNNYTDTRATNYPSRFYRLQVP